MQFCCDFRSSPVASLATIFSCLLLLVGPGPSIVVQLEFMAGELAATL